jgi:hypothetical protein
MDRTQLSKLRRFALLAVVSNLAALVLLSALLPHVLLPIAALILPLITAAIVEAALEHKPRTAARKLPLGSVTHVHRALAQH